MDSTFPPPDLDKLRSKESELETDLELMKVQSAQLTRRIIRTANNLSECKKAIGQLTLPKNRMVL